jgi:hypothetical protein
MRLSLTLIAAFCFLKSFASGLGFAWYNPNAAFGSCTAADVTKIDDAVKSVFAQYMGTAMNSWSDLQYGSGRKLRGRDLVCTQACIDKCRLNPYLCYGCCAGCRRRSMFTVDRELVGVSKEQMEYQCAKKVQGEAKNVSPSCAAGIQNALCEVAL